ncbi:MAG: PAS domain-containing sensor histidine kinase [Elusimicrobia bacterium]|nr:PAS domain-containing sensor histidine kinase [Elusimicrobiota bacterium]
MLTFDEIAELKVKMQAIIFSIQDGVVMTDFEGHVLVLNDHAKKILNIEKNYPYEKKFIDYIENEWVKSQMEMLLKSQEAFKREELIIYSGAKESYYQITKNLVTTAQGVVLGQVVVLRDITPEKEFEKLKDDFVHSITHDLKSPITSIQGFIKLFLEDELGVLTQEQKRYLEIMAHSTNDLLKMINDILDMAKLEAGKMPIAKSHWDAVKAVSKLVENLQPVAQHCKVKLFLTLVPSPGKKLEKLALFVDGALIERAIQNLLDNALKFTPGGGEIEIKVEDFSEKAQISVRDTGRGIPEEALEKIFQKFHQGSGSKSGSGLGLTIAKHIIEAHSGQLTVNSQVSKGSLFQFSLLK